MIYVCVCGKGSKYNWQQDYSQRSPPSCQRNVYKRLHTVTVPWLDCCWLVCEREREWEVWRLKWSPVALPPLLPPPSISPCSPYHHHLQLLYDLPASSFSLKLGPGGLECFTLCLTRRYSLLCYIVSDASFLCLSLQVSEEWFACHEYITGGPVSTVMVICFCFVLFFRPGDHVSLCGLLCKCSEIWKIYFEWIL